MKTGKELYDEHLNRLKTAIALEKPDRTPILLGADGFLLKYAEPSATLSDFVNRTEWANEKALEGLLKLGDVDGVTMFGAYPTSTIPMWLATQKLPGRELPDDELWQIIEPGTMTEDDYDTIINKGWKHFSMEFMSKLGFDPAEMGTILPLMQKMQGKAIDKGVVIAGGMTGGVPLFDSLSSARSLPKFIRDLYRIPDKVKAALDAAMVELVEDMVTVIKNSEPKPLMVIVAPAVRANCSFLSRKMFEEFAWPLFKKFTDAAIEAGTNVIFHMDSKWDDFLDFFLDFPKGRCIFDPDGATDIYKIKEVLGGHMCITCDTPAPLLTLGTPDKVYKYCEKLINEIGPSGFIMASGCSVPPNAKPENVEAMIAAALDS